MSTDTALALGFLSVLGRAVPGRVRVFLLTVLIVDDLVALAVIAGFYSGPISWLPLVVAVAVFAVFLAHPSLRRRRPARLRRDGRGDLGRPARRAASTRSWPG